MSRRAFVFVAGMICLSGCPSTSSMERFAGIIVLDASNSAPKGYYKDFAYLKLRQRLMRCVSQMDLNLVSRASDSERVLLSTSCVADGAVSAYFVVDVRGYACSASHGADPCRVDSMTKMVDCAGGRTRLADGVQGRERLQKMSVRLSAAVDAIVEDEERLSLVRWAAYTGDSGQLALLATIDGIDDSAVCKPLLASMVVDGGRFPSRSGGRRGSLGLGYDGLQFGLTSMKH